MSREQRKEIAATFSSQLSPALLRLLPRFELLHARAVDLGADKTVAELTAVQQMVLDEMGGADSDEIDTLISDYLRTGYHASFSVAMGDKADEVDDEETGDGPPKYKRLERLLDTVNNLKNSLILGTAVAVGVALMSEHPKQNYDTVFGERADVFAIVELTAATTAGALGAAGAQHLGYVRIVSTPECEFCQGYEGRILGTDEEDGMPPLHHGCQCDIEPLE